MACATARNPPSAATTTSSAYTATANGQQQNPGDAEDQPDDQHAEGGNHEDLTEQAGHEGAAEGMRDGIGDHFEIGPTEHHQPEAERGEREEHTEDAREPPADVASALGSAAATARRAGAKIRVDRSVRISPPISPPMFRTSPPSARMSPETRAPGCTITSPSTVTQVPVQPAVDVRVALDHEQVPFERLGRADAEVSQARGAAGDGDTRMAPSSGCERGLELALDLGGIGQVARGPPAECPPARRESACGCGRAGAPGHPADSRPGPRNS